MGARSLLRLVSRVGIEPTTRGLKVPCSATELPARNAAEFTSKTHENQRAPPIPHFGLVRLSVSLSEEK
jgi:hypothetical protein